VTCSPSARSQEVTAPIADACGPNLLANCPGRRYWRNSGELLSVTAAIKPVSAPSSRGWSTTSAVCVAESGTAPISLAPAGISGLAVTVRTPGDPAVSAAAASGAGAMNAAATRMTTAARPTPDQEPCLADADDEKAPSARLLLRIMVYGLHPPRPGKKEPELSA
jgi:hypothetical protein